MSTSTSRNLRHGRGIVACALLALALLAGCGGNPAPPPDPIVLTRAWSAAQLLDTGSSGAYAVQIAFSANGTAIAVWAQDDGMQFSIYANRYVPGAGWGTADLIESGGDFAYDPAVAMDASGNAIALWHQFSGATLHIHANRYVAGVGWGMVEQIEFGGSHAYTPQIAMDANGNAMAVWYQFDGGAVQNIRANRYVAGVGWDTAQLIEAGGFDAAEPQVAVDQNGNAMAVWAQYDGSAYSIYANRYAAGVGWVGEQLIEAGGPEAYGPQIVLDGSGNALAVWYQHDGTVYDIHANRYAAGVGWGAAQIIDGGTEEAIYPQLAIDGGGNAIAVWEQSDGVVRNVHAGRYVAGVGWGAPQLIENGSGQVRKPQIAIDGSGNAIATWGQHDGVADSIYASRYPAGGAWGTPQSLETGSEDGLDPQVAVHGSGDAIVVWYQSDGVAPNIHAALFD